MNGNIWIYVYKFSINLKYPHKLKKQKVSNLKDYISEVIEEEHNIRTLNDMYSRFGKPKDVANNYLNLRSVEEGRRYHKELLLKLLLFFLLCTVFICVIIIICQLNKPTIVIQPKTIEKVTSMLNHFHLDGEIVGLHKF